MVKQGKQKVLLTTKELATRWSCSTKTIDKLRMQGHVPWLDLSFGTGCRPTVRFRLEDIIKMEKQGVMAVTG